MASNRWLKAIKKWRKYLILLLTPILLSPLPLVLQDKRASCAYAIMIMAIYWTTESCSLAVTSLLPLLLFPILGVVKAKEISTPYFSDTNVLFVGGMMLAVAVEQWNLHKRIALKILLLIGTQPRRLLLGFMCPTAFLSMWVSNTATTAMMVPIAQAVLGEIKGIKELGVGKNETDSKDEVIENCNAEQVEMKVIDGRTASTSKMTTMDELSNEEGQKEFSNLCKATMLSIAYAANVGGTATLTGTGTNLVLVGQTEELFDESGGIGFGDWFVFAFPEAIILLFICWIWLQWMFLGFNFRTIANCFRRRNHSEQSQLEHSLVKRVIQREYDALGPMTFAEKGVLVHFVILALLWIVRDPKFVSGWSALFKEGYVRDATASIAVAFSLFNFPAKRPRLFDDEDDENEDKDRPFPTLLEWKVLTKKFPWNIVLLLGAGFAMAKAAKVSCLSEWLGEQMASLQSIPQFYIVLILCLVLCLFTEVTSNVATASIFLPIVGSVAVNIKIHPWYLMVPATLSCSFAYMLPVATPPNAIIFSSGYLKVFDMVRAGIMMNIIGITVLLLWTHSVGALWFNLSEFPSWATVDDSNATKCWV